MRNLKEYDFLYAEDSKVMQKIIGRMLCKLGCEPEIIDNGLDARKRLMSENPPHIAILDWDMPGVDGVDLCKEVKNRDDGIFVYVIILTVHEIEDAQLALSYGADKFITKDAGIEAFSEVIDEAIEILISCAQCSQLQSFGIK